MRRSVIITLDGPSAAGKGTVAKELSKRLGFKYMDTGALYRAVAVHMKRLSVSIDDGESLKKALGQARIVLTENEDSSQIVTLNGEDITAEIRTPEISKLASDVAVNSAVRSFLRRLQRQFASGGGVVVEGRDMGTVVFPDAEFKFYLDAPISERARRRWLQLRDSGIEANLDDVQRDMETRDIQDSERDDSPLHPAADAVIIHTIDKSASEVVDMIFNTVDGVAD